MPERVLSYQESLPVIRHFASRVLRRLHAAGARTVTLDDVVQELSIVYLKSAERFDPQHGIKFATYLTGGMRLYINRWVQQQIDEGAHASMDESASEEGEEGYGHRVVATDEPTPDAIVEALEHKRRVVDRLSPRARQFVEFLESPPLELLQEAKALVARGRFARERGHSVFVPVQVGAQHIFALMGADRRERHLIYGEIRKAVAEVDHDQ